MAQIFDQLTQNKQAIIDAVVTVLQSVPDEHDYAQDIRHIVGAAFFDHNMV